MNWNQEVGEKIRYWREERKWTQAQLGLLVFRKLAVRDTNNAAQQRIKKFELGEQELRLSEAVLLCKALKIHLKDIIPSNNPPSK